MRTSLIAVGLALALAGCIEDADVTLEPDPNVDGAVDADADADAAPLAAPMIVIEPAALAFAAPGDRQALTVRNDGDAPLHLGRVLRNGSTGFSLTWRGANAFVALPEPLTIPPGAAELFEAEALAEPPAAAEFVFFSDDPTRPAVAVAAAYDLPCLQADPPALDFARVTPGEAAIAAIRLHNCGDRPLPLTRVALAGDGSGFTLGESTFPVAIEAGASFAVEIVFQPRREGLIRDTLHVESEGVSLAVPLGGRSARPNCPVPIADGERPRVLREPIALDATAVLAGEPGPEATFVWVVTDRPPGSIAPIVEHFFDPAQPANGGLAPDPRTPRDWFMPDLIGRYGFELRYADADGCTAEARTGVNVAGGEGEGFVVEVTWETPGERAAGEGADLDLHLLHPVASNWFDSIYDCHYANPTPDWGQIANAADDPVLLEEVTGAGTERITLVYPETAHVLGHPYGVGVHYYGWEGEPPPAPVSVTATVRIWMWGEPVAERSRALAPGQFWHPFAIDWPADGATVVDQLFDERP
ncbi:MAG: hypothetical protein R3F65_08035 [bacterium]